MNTQTHLLLAATVLGGGRSLLRQRIVLFGALLPDLSIFTLVLVGALTGGGGAQMWEVTYWSEPWQTLSAISNSVPLWLAVTTIGVAVRKPRLWLLGSAALLHLAFDLPLHAEDAHRHFWPFSDYRFHSPLSYWDRDRHGAIVSVIEATLGLSLCGILWRRHASRSVRAALVLCGLSYGLLPLFWVLSLG